MAVANRVAAERRAERISFGGVTDPPDRVARADNLAMLETIGDDTIDTIYVDPPFATGTVRRGSARPGRAATGFRDAPDDPERFVDWLTPRLAHCRRVLRPHGSLFVHLDYRAVHYVKVALDRLFGRERFVNELIWCYSVGGRSRRSFARKHDTILWYARTAGYAFYPDAVRIARKSGSHMRVVRDSDGRLVQEKTDRKTGKVYRYPVAAGKVPEDWWTDIETLNRDDAERVGWPTQKPARLLERIVLATTGPDDVVADWFAGAGTTAVVAQRHGRRFVTCDVEPAAVKLTVDRLRAAGRALADARTPPRDVIVDRSGKSHSAIVTASPSP